MLSRQEFLKLSGFTSGLLLFNPMSLLSKLHEKTDDEKLNLLFSPDEIPEIKRRLELTLFQNFWEETLNIDYKDDPIEIRQIIGMLSHAPLLYDELTAYENLYFYGKMFNIKPELLRDLIKDYLRKVGLIHRMHDRNVLRHIRPPRNARQCNARMELLRAAEPLAHVGRRSNQRWYLDRTGSVAGRCVDGSLARAVSRGESGRQCARTLNGRFAAASGDAHRVPVGFRSTWRSRRRDAAVDMRKRHRFDTRALGGKTMRSRYQMLPSIVSIPLIFTSSPYASPTTKQPKTKSHTALVNVRHRGIRLLDLN